MSISAGADPERRHQRAARCRACARRSRTRASCSASTFVRGQARAGRSRGRRRSARGSSRARRRRRSRPSRSRSRAAGSRAPGPGCCRPPRSARCGCAGSAGHVREARAPRGAGRGRRRAASRPSANSHPPHRRTRSRWSWIESPKLLVLARSETIRSRSTSARISCSSAANRSACAEQVAVLVDQRLAVPGEVGRRLAEPGRRVDVGGDRPRRLRAAHSRWR